ncbi:MAG TPA: thioredoxin [Opitutaceae bacterium]|nr:thioredoxin [Opitutaceae bacterium]
MSANISELTAANFQETITKSPLPVLVDFWAPWCGPCKAITPILEELSKDLAGKLAIAKVNVDEAGEIAAQFGIRAIPTMILFKQGQAVDTFVGLVDKATLRAKVAVKL